MRALYTTLLSVIFIMGCGPGTNEKTDTTPNIILMTIDDLGYKDLGFMGSEYYETPNIDALAKLGMVFTNGYAAAANCAPSRASIMTGKWTTRHGIYTVGSSERGKAKHRKLIPTANTTTLSKEHTVLPEILQQHGYRTIHSGKWHLSKNPLDYGFDINIGGNHAGSPRSYYPPFDHFKLEDTGAGYLTDLIMDHTVQALDTVQQPFFLNYTPYAVHTPIQAVDSLTSKYEVKKGWQGQKNAKYASMVENLDRNIGNLIRTLKKNGQFNSTFIVFTSDNGGLFGITEQRPLRAGKGSYYEGGIREPFFFVYEKRIAPHSFSDVPITHLDLFPTLLEVAHVNAETYPTDGADILPVLEQKTSRLDRSLFWHFPIYLQAYNPSYNENRDSLFRTRPGSVIRKGDWKLHYYFEDDGQELYRLDRDIGERNNLIEAHPRKAEELLVDLKNWWQSTNAPIPIEMNPEYNP